MYVLANQSAVIKFPYSLSDLRKDNPNTSFPSSMEDEALASWGVFLVQDQTPPSFDPATETLIQDEPVLREGQWLQQWSVVKASADEVEERLNIQSDLVRQERNQKLADCDWTQLPDSPVNANEWALYRQQLRDLTSQEGFPWLVVWPEPQGN